MKRFKSLALRVAAISLFALPASFGTLAACNGQAGTVCADACDCTHCNDRDEELCINAVSAEFDRAAAYDCTLEFQDYVDCALETSDCNLDRKTATISYEIDPDCITNELADYNKCLADQTNHGPKGGKTPF